MQTKSVELITNCLICREPSHHQPEPHSEHGEAEKLINCPHPSGLSRAMGQFGTIYRKMGRNMYGIIIFKLCLDGRFRLLLIF